MWKFAGILHTSQCNQGLFMTIPLLTGSNVSVRTQIKEGKERCEYPIIMKDVISVVGN